MKTGSPVRASCPESVWPRKEMLTVERVDKILSSCTLYSRKEIKAWIKKGAVTANGVPVRSCDEKYNPENTHFVLDGSPVQYRKYVYLMLNKPQGVVSATQDNRETTVLDLIGEEFRSRGVFPAGRLDKDTTGFVLLTDDGGFAHDILSPSRHVPKTYIVTLQRPVEPQEQEEIEKGMVIGGEALMPAYLRLLDEGENRYEIRIRQGKYHQIKRMFARFGNSVTALRRIAIGGLALDESLAEGQWRELTEQEVSAIRQTDAAEGADFSAESDA